MILLLHWPKLVSLSCCVQMVERMREWHLSRLYIHPLSPVGISTTNPLTTVRRLSLAKFRNRLFFSVASVTLQIDMWSCRVSVRVRVRVRTHRRARAQTLRQRYGRSLK